MLAAVPCIASDQEAGVVYLEGSVGLLLIATRDIAGRTQRRIGKNVADLRARGRRKRSHRRDEEGRKTSQENGSDHLAAFVRRIGLATV